MRISNELQGDRGRGDGVWPDPAASRGIASVAWDDGARFGCSMLRPRRQRPKDFSTTEMANILGRTLAWTMRVRPVQVVASRVYAHPRREAQPDVYRSCQANPLG